MRVVSEGGRPLLRPPRRGARDTAGPWRTAVTTKAVDYFNDLPTVQSALVDAVVRAFSEHERARAERAPT